MTMSDRFNTTLSWLHYPVVVIGTFALFAWLQSRGASLVVSTYVPVILAAAVVTVLEFAFPHRTEWRPGASDVKTDQCLSVEDGRPLALSGCDQGGAHP